MLLSSRIGRALQHSSSAANKLQLCLIFLPFIQRLLSLHPVLDVARRRIMWLPVASMLLLLLCSSCFLLVSAVEIPATLLEKAIEHAKQLEDSENIIQELQNGDINTLYQVAKSMNTFDDSKIASIQIWQALADGDAQHVLSQVALGFAYSQEFPSKAVEYFVRAGENDKTPHQASLYNAGKLFLEMDQFAESLAYLRACVNLEKTNQKYATPQMTKTCRFAYQTLSSQLKSKQDDDLSIQQVADMFLYADLSNFPLPNSNEANLWDESMLALQQQQNYETALQNFATLHSNPKMSDLQLHLLEILTRHTMKLIQDSNGGEL